MPTSCLNCGGTDCGPLSWNPCLFCGGYLNPCRRQIHVRVTYVDKKQREGLAHVVCVEAEQNWQALGLAPRIVTTDP